MKTIPKAAPKELTEFSKKVILLIKSIPSGKVATYGQIAKLAGKEQGSRRVSWVLHACSKSHKLPWQRVIGAAGKISFHPMSSEYIRQKRLLKQEGIVFGEGDMIDLSRFRWKKSASRRKPNRAVRKI